MRGSFARFSLWGKYFAEIFSTIVSAAKETGGIIVVEEHNLSGGVGSAVAEVLMDEGCGNIPFRRTAFQDVNVTKVGSQIWLRDQYGLGVCDIVNAVKSIGKRG